MKRDADSRRALQTIGNFVLQAATRGDTADMQKHLEVYLAVVKALKKQATEGRG